MSEETPREERKKSGQLSGLQVMFAVILAISLILAINFTSRISINRPLQEAYDRVQAEIDQLREQQGELLDQRDYVASDEYVEAWARSEGKMVRPGEVLIVPVPSGVVIEAESSAAVQSVVAVETTPPDPDPWMLWWSLFFDSPPPEF